jgi:hypothetical protein
MKVQGSSTGSAFPWQSATHSLGRTGASCEAGHELVVAGSCTSLTGCAMENPAGECAFAIVGHTADDGETWTAARAVGEGIMVGAIVWSVELSGTQAVATSEPPKRPSISVPRLAR